VSSGNLNHVELIRPSNDYIRKVSDAISSLNIVKSVSVTFAGEGIDELSYLVRECPSITVLTLKTKSSCPNRLKKHSRQFSIFFSALSTSGSLRSLTIQSIQLGDKEMKLLGDALKCNGMLEQLKLCNTYTDGFSDNLTYLFDGLAENKSIYDITLAKYVFTSRKLTDSFVNLFTVNTTIRHIALSGCLGKGNSPYFLDMACKTLGSNTNIMSIALMYMVPLDVHHIHFLLTNVTSLNLERLYIGNTLIGDESAELIATFLEGNPKLINLDLPSCNITGKGLTMIGKSLVNNLNLKQLGIAYNHLFEQGGLKSFLDYISENQYIVDLECHPIIGIPIVEEDRFYRLRIKNIVDRNRKIGEKLFDSLVHVVSEECDCGEDCKLRK